MRVEGGSARIRDAGKPKGEIALGVEALRVHMAIGNQGFQPDVLGGGSAFQVERQPAAIFQPGVLAEDATADRGAGEVERALAPGVGEVDPLLGGAPSQRDDAARAEGIVEPDRPGELGPARAERASAGMLESGSGQGEQATDLAVVEVDLAFSHHLLAGEIAADGGAPGVEGTFAAVAELRSCEHELTVDPHRDHVGQPADASAVEPEALLHGRRVAEQGKALGRLQLRPAEAEPPGRPRNAGTAR